MSDDELPGAQLHRTVISMDDVSDDDDDGFAMLQTGKERKEALRKAETEKAKRKLADSRTSTGDGEEEDDVVCTSGPAASKRPARASRTAAPASNSAGTVVDSPGLELEEQDHALLARQAKQKEEIDRMRAAFLADDEDEDEDGGTPSARTRVAPPHVPRTTARGGGLEGAREKQLWVTAKCLSLGADSYEMFRADRDVPLREGLVQKVAETFGLLPPRVQFSMEPQTGELASSASQSRLLDLDRTPRQLWAAGLTKVTVYVEEGAIATIPLKLSRAGGEPVVMKAMPDAPLRELLSKYCLEHGTGALSAASARLRFDGEMLDLSLTPKQADLEEDDMLEVVGR